MDKQDANTKHQAGKDTTEREPWDGTMPERFEVPTDGRKAAQESPAPVDKGKAAPEDKPGKDRLAKQAPAVGTFLADAIQQMVARSIGKEKPVPFPAWWKQTTAAMNGGLWPGLHILVGNTGSGKSQWALQTAYEAAKGGTPVLYVGLELGQCDLVARLAGLATGRKWSQIWLGRDEAGLLDLRNKVSDILRSLPFHLELAPPFGWDYLRLRDRAADIAATYTQRPFLIVLDFLQLVTSPESRSREELRERIQKAAYVGRSVAREFGAAVLCVSSTARDNYTQLEGNERGTGNGKKLELGKTPPNAFVGLGKESGEIEYAADSVLVLCRKPWDVPDKDGGPPTPPADGSHIWLAVAKLRAGLPSWVQLRFDGGRFTEPLAPEKL